MTNLLTEDKGAVRILTLNRPEKRNALDTALSRALLEALRAADGDETVRCVVLTGAGPAFCAGADLAEFKRLRDPQAAETRAELTMQLHLAFSKMITPVVTAINGAAMGGGAGLAIAGDLAVMASSAKLGYPETKHGIVAAIVMANLVRQVGRKAAFELVAVHLPVTNSDPRVWYQALDNSGNLRDVLHFIMYKKNLASAVQLEAYSIPDHFFIKSMQFCLHRVAVRRRRRYGG